MSQVVDNTDKRSADTLWHVKHLKSIMFKIKNQNIPSFVWWRKNFCVCQFIDN